MEDENKQLLSEFDELMKKIVRFYPCVTNHKLEVLAMSASPNKYIVATGSSDLSCRLWKVDPDAKKANERMQVYQRSMVEGKVDCISWNFDGTLLAAGSGYKDGPDGYVVIWSMDGIDKYNSIYAIRSRPTVRFGRVKSISFSTRNNQFVYCGDITGQIWVFDLIKEAVSTGSGLIGVIQTQNDVINDLAISMDGSYLYSVSLDKKLAAINLPEEFGGNKTNDSQTLSADNDNNNNSKRKKSIGGKRKSKNKVSTPTNNNGKALSLATQTSNRSMKSLKLSANSSNSSVGSNNRGRSKTKTKSDTIKYSLSELLADESMPTLKHCKGVIIGTDKDYPFWKLALSNNGKNVICASRKVRIFNINGNPTQTENVSKGPNVTDSDLEHVRSLKLRNGKLLLCRTLVPRAKLFDIRDGKEIKKFNCKAPVQAVEFLADNAHIVICTQEYSAESCFPPLMKLVSYSDKRVTIEKEDEQYVVSEIDANGASVADMQDNGGTPIDSKTTEISTQTPAAIDDDEKTDQ